MPDTAVAEINPGQRTIGGFFLPRIQTDQNERNIEIDYSKFHEEGTFQYKPLKGVVKPGIQFIRDDVIPTATLELQQKGRIIATTGAVALNILASAGLFYSGFKLISNTLFGKGDESEAFQSLSSSYTKSSIAGVLTGFAHESPIWAFGNLGMGIFSRYLNDIFGLAGFLFSDGLASIGMGQVRFREKGNSPTFQDSIFNNPSLTYLSFLRPIEQAIYSFIKKCNPKDWKLFKEVEPYALFNSAGGGLALAGGLLGLASIAKNKLSEKVKSFAYLPAAIFSIGSLVAFYRDGAVEVDRSYYYGGGQRKAENLTERTEGYSKKIASPFLAVRNILFAIKGLGMDTNGTLHNLAIGAQAFGAAFAFLGFTAQSFFKFFKPELFGPKIKQFIEIVLEPKIAARYLKKLIGYLGSQEGHTKYEVKDDVTPQFCKIIEEDRHSQILKGIAETGIFKSKYDISQTGLPNYTNDKTFSRFYLDRGTHHLRTCGIVIKLINALKRNTRDKSILAELVEKELAIKIATLIHDIGHGPLSHVLDKAVPGHDNDRETILMIRDETSELHQAILRECSKAGIDGKKVIADILDILGRYSGFYQLVSGWAADRIDYTRFSDFPLVNNGRVMFPKWEMSDMDNYLETFRLYRDENGDIKAGFTPEGALIAFLMCSDREVFDVAINGGPSSRTIDLIAAIALADASPNEIKNDTEPKVLDLIFKKIEKLKRGEATINSKQYKGGRNGYSYYSPIPDDPTCIQVVNGHASEFLSYLQHSGIRNYLDDLNETSPWFRKHPIPERELLSRIKAATTLHEFYTRVHVRNND